METHDAILMFAASESHNKDSSSAPNLGPTEFDDVSSVVQSSYITSPSDQGIPPSSTTPAKPAQEKSLLGSLSFPELKSGFEEPAHPIDAASFKDDNTRLKNSQSPRRCSPVGSPHNGTNTGAAKGDITIPVQDTPQQPQSKASVAECDEHVSCWANFINMVMWTEWVAFMCVTGLLIASLTVHKLRKTDILEVELWKWCVLVLAIFFGRLVSEMLMTTLGFLIEGKPQLKEKVLYLLYGLRHSVQVFFWLVFVLSVWRSLIYLGGKRSRHAREIQSYVTRALASCLVGAAIWLIKTLLIKLLAASFHHNAFFGPIQVYVERHQVITMLSGNQLMEREGKNKGQLSFMNYINGVAEKLEELIDAEMLTRMKGHRISAWHMRRLISAITGSGISIFDGSLDHPDQEINIRSEAAETARKIFKHVDPEEKGCIKGKDLVPFMEKEEDVAKFIRLIQGPEGNGKIDKPTLENWLETVHREKKLLARTLKDADTVIDDLNRLVSAIVLVVITIMSLLIMGLLTTETLIFISSQLLLVVFMFGNTARTVFEAVIFIFVTHPFDVEDRCVIDGVQLVVKKMDILTTTFVRYDGEKIYYPNSVLATKPISNFNRSDNMGDSVEFTVDFSTSVNRIADLKEQVKKYLESKPNYWKNEHSVVVKEIEDVNKLKMGLFVTHTINFQNPGDRSSRRSELVLELKRIFEEVGITYRLLPQEVQVGYAGSAARS